VRLGATEAVTIVRDLTLQVSRGVLPGVPSAHVIRLAASGELTIEGPVAADGRGVTRAAQLLDSLLPGFEAPSELRVPGALRLIIARALGTLDLPPYPSLDSFALALARFAAPDPRAALRHLVAGALAAGQGAEPRVDIEPSAAEPPVSVERRSVARLATMRPDAARETPAALELQGKSLTISDIRRARRATRLTLRDIAERSRIPAWLLRELEWGYVRNWPGGHYGRTQLVRYARASGLDDQLVVRTVWPMLDESRAHDAPIVPAVAMADSFVEGVVEEENDPAASTAVTVSSRSVVQTGRAVSRRSRMLAALAIPALLALGVMSALWQRAAEPTPAATPQIAARTVTEPALPVPPSSVPAADAPVQAVAPPATKTATPIAQSDAVAAEGPVATSSTPERVLPDAAVYSPSFASVGSAMFYHAQSEGESSLMRADTDSGGAVLRVTSVVDDNARNFHARPSPDGDRIAFDSDREGERGVYIADSDGKNVRRVSGPGFAAIPSWSPDGGTLAYVRAEPDRPRVWNLWISDLETGEEKRLTSFTVGQPWGGSWFPDGQRIAYSHETRLIIHDLETGRERVYPSPVKGRLVRTPAVSPDGTRIVFQVYRDGAWLLDLKDGSMRKVLSDPSAEEYTWSPDGRRVAYHSRRSGNWGVWMMSAR
jgi:cytoskeletal protein RodZ